MSYVRAGGVTMTEPQWRALTAVCVLGRGHVDKVTHRSLVNSAAARSLCKMGLVRIEGGDVYPTTEGREVFDAGRQAGL